MTEKVIRGTIPERVEMLVHAQTDPKIQAVHMELCRRDPVYWFNNFCWTFDPRKTIPDIPFVLYDYQEWFLDELINCVDNQEDLLIEKSRDMGVSWMIVLGFQYLWLFKTGYNFHIGSRREAEVDQALIDPAETLFGKFRYNLYRLPTWMQPPVNDKKLNIQNVSNQNLFTGESSNPSFARGARKRAVLFDELAFWESADAAWASASQTTNCRIALSTPYGESNKYAKLAMDPNNDVLVFHKAEQRQLDKGYLVA